MIDNIGKIATDKIKSISNKIPVFLMKQPNPSMSSCNHSVQSSTTKELFAKGFISPKSLDIIDPRYYEEGEYDKNYWEDTLGNKKFGVADFLKWLKDNSAQFASTIKEKEINIDFWRWAKKNVNSADGRKVLSVLPVLQNEIDNYVSPASDVVYVSNEYLDKDDKKREEFIKQFDTSGAASIISPAYIEKEAKDDDIRTWREFWIAVGVHYEIFEILKETVIKGLSELDNEEIPGLIAQYREKLEGNDPRSFQR